MKKYDVFGIGNAIVDIVTEVEYDFFEKNNIEKGVMTLVDEKRQIELMKVIDMKRSKMSGGGSAGNPGKPRRSGAENAAVHRVEHR